VGREGRDLEGGIPYLGRRGQKGGGLWEKPFSERKGGMGRVGDEGWSCRGKKTVGERGPEKRHGPSSRGKPEKMKNQS